MPPSMTTFWPVMKPVASDTRYVHIAAISSGWPTRPAGCWDRSALGIAERRVIDHDVEMPVRLERGGHRGSDCVFVRDVDFAREHGRQRRERVGGVVHRLAVDVEQAHGRARARQGMGNGPADAAAGAGHQRAATGEIELAGVCRYRGVGVEGGHGRLLIAGSPARRLAGSPVRRFAGSIDGRRRVSRLCSCARARGRRDRWPSRDRPG